MVTTTTPERYAPLDLTVDPAQLGLETITVTSDLGSAVARHRRTVASPRATIFLHGAAGSWTTWTPLLQTAENAGVVLCNPVLIDLPGWGDGTLTERGEDVAIEAVCSLVKDCAEELGYTEWDIVGHSMGGFIALHMASIWPGSVMSVGIISATGQSIIDSVEHPLRHFFRLPAFIMLWQAMRLLKTFGSGGTAFVRWLGTIGVLRGLVTPLFRHTGRIPPRVIAALGSELRPRAFTVAASIANGYDLVSHWSRIQSPVRAIRGDDDVFSTADDLARVDAVVTHCTSTTISDCGHFAAIERPGAVLAALGYLD